MKLERLAEEIRPLLPLLRCPLCGSSFALEGTESLVCESRHTFDLSRKGYINLAPSHNQGRDKYDGPLFESRRSLLNAGFFQPLTDTLRAMILARMPREGAFTLLDAGCGEGYYARQLQDIFPAATILGLDISRDAIIAAARGGNPIHWVVGNLAQLPFQDGIVDFLLNLLTPADYSEFARVLSPGGFLLKVVPGEDYLRQVRSCLAPRLRQEEYSNQPVLSHLQRHAEILERQTLCYNTPVTEAEAQAFARMTPMAFGMPDDVLDKVSFTEITIHLEVVCCRVKKIV